MHVRDLRAIKEVQAFKIIETPVNTHIIILSCKFLYSKRNIHSQR